MKKSAVSLAVLSALSTASFAQSSVTLYGIVDAAIAVEDTGETGKGSRKVLNSGNQSSSRFGVRGGEDLGGGLTAEFNIESGLALDTGAADSAFWGRRAVVGLKGGFGSLFLGREYSPIAGVAAASDIFGQGFFGTNLSAFTSGRLSRRLSNSVSYRTPSFGGVQASFVASPSEGVSSASRVLGTAVEYSMGRLYAGAGYHDLERASTGLKDKEYAFGVGYGVGAFDFKGNYLVADPAGADNKFEQFNMGVSFGFGSGRLLANLQQSRIVICKALGYTVVTAAEADTVETILARLLAPLGFASLSDKFGTLARILGIAPLVSVFDKSTGDFKYEKPLFWIHYPTSREVFARYQVFNPVNDASVMSWEDVFEMRQFAATIYKESNVADRRIEEYASGRDQLLEGQKISSEIFNFEHDLWSW